MRRLKDRHFEVSDCKKCFHLSSNFCGYALYRLLTLLFEVCGEPDGIDFSQSDPNENAMRRNIMCWYKLG